MNEVVPRNKAAVVNVLPAADRNNRSRATKLIKTSTAFGSKSKENAPIAEVTPPIEANRTIPRIGSVSKILAPTLQKDANIVIEKIMRPKIVSPASNVGAGNIFGVTATVDP